MRGLSVLKYQRSGIGKYAGKTTIEVESYIKLNNPEWSGNKF
jgi:hypothetical protein